MTRPSEQPTRPIEPVATPVSALVGDGVGLAAGAVEPGPTEVTGMSLSSQRVCPGDLYAALPGSKVHGIDFVAAAIDAGAVAVLTDPSGATRAGELPMPVLVADAPRRLLGALAARIYGNPGEALQMIGVTGTQGKTTTTRLIESGLQGAGVTAGVIGTVGTRMAGRAVPTLLTTPEAPDLHGLFARMREESVQVVAMEVSSHALVMGRVDGVVFDIAVFLNLGRDHLDFHRDVEDYFRAKAALFAPERARQALVCVDDEHGRRLASEVTIPVQTFSLRSSDADWTVSDVSLGPSGSDFVVHGPDVDLPAHCPLPGDFNIANTLAAIAAVAAGTDDAGLHEFVSALGSGGGVPGRLERIDEGQDFTVVVDYAHKPDAVEAAIATLRPLTDGRVIVVLGAGGDRDTGKRPVMGEIASRLADVVIVTDDNPRSEDPAAIRDEILKGAGTVGAQMIEVGDRRDAITKAVTMAHADDIVIVAGKGHETGQEVDGVVHGFDDRQVAREVLRAAGRPPTG